MRILAIDWGEKNIGLALSDELGLTAQGLPSLRARTDEQAITAVNDLLKEHHVSELVVGMPLNMDGTAGKKAKQAASFAQKLKAEVKVPVKLWDERLSTLQAEKVLLEADVSRRKRKKKVDKLSAQLILQSYLDAGRQDNV